MEENEIYKDIIGFDGLYQISNFGNVKSLKCYGCSSEKILKPCKDSKGYLLVYLYKDGKKITMKVHRLVADAFIPNDDLFKTDINHIDENKENNHINNLEWCTHKYNINYGTRKEKVLQKLTNGKLSKLVNQYSVDGTFIKTWKSMNEIQRQLGYSHQNISKCCNSIIKTAYGFIWKFVE